MKKFKAFWYIFYNSLVSTNYYKDILKTPFSFSLKYFFVLSILASITTSSFIFAQLIPKINDTLENFKSTVLKTFPLELEITFKDGSWNINKPEPYFIPTPNELVLEQKKYIKKNNPNNIQNIEVNSITQNLIVFNKKGTINDFNMYNTLILLNENNVILKSSNGFEARTIKNVEDITINYQSVKDFLGYIDQKSKYVPYILIVLLSLILFTYFFFVRGIYLLMITFSLLVVNMFIKPNIELKDLYRIGLHSMTLPLVLEVILISGMVYLNIGIPWFYLLNLIIGSVVIYTSAKVNEK